MVFSNEEDLAENEKNFLFYVTNQMMNSIAKAEKIHGQKLLNPLEYGEVDCFHNKAANGTCSRDIFKTTAISEMEFFMTIVNRGVLKIFTNIKFSS